MNERPGFLEEVSVFALVAELAILSSGDTTAVRVAVEEWERTATDGQPTVYQSQPAYFRRDTASLAYPLWAPSGLQKELTFSDYTFYPDGPPRLWRARMAWELVFAGEPDRAREEADRAVDLYPLDADATDAMFFLRQRMLVRVVTGDLDGAVADLRILLPASGFATPFELRLDPIYDPLRGRADFQGLLSERG